MKRILVIRFSALGDVAMLVPMVQRWAIAYPDYHFTILSRQQTVPLWNDMPENVRFFGADLKGKHRGIAGLNRLLEEIEYKRFDFVADMHGVLRSRYLCFRLALRGTRIAHIHKGRWQKWLLTHRQTPIIGLLARTLPSTLPTTISRYEAVANSLEFTLSPASTMGSTTHRSGIGIAPFAAHRGKIYPRERMEQVVRQLGEYCHSRSETVYLFGAGENEKAILEEWEKEYTGVISLAGKQALDREVDIMRGLRLMITMDSSNMHLASLAGTRVISIWGATHPRAGFLGYGQDEQDCIGLELPCRPCSIYGNKPCIYGDYRCLNISVNTIVEKVINLLTNANTD